MEWRFRGKDLQGRWFYGNVCVLTSDKGSVKPGSYISNSVGMPFAYAVRPETVSPFTGCRDSNKTDIYRGDVILITDEDGESSYFTEVKFDDGAFIVDVEGYDWDFTAIGWAIDHWAAECNKWEVVGNIWDNPELIRKEVQP